MLRRRAVVLAILAFSCAMLAFSVHAFAQSSPFGAPRPPSQPVADGIFGWILQKQAEFYRGLSAAVRSAKADGSAVWGLLGLSFAYGIFHAAGPGHGKGVISSYVVANQETWTRGVVLSFASAFLQAVVAVVIVGIAAVLLNATAGTMAQAVRYIEIVSYGLIVLLGLRLIWTKGRAFLAAWRGQEETHDHGHAHHHDHAHAHHDHAHHAHDHHHEHAHGHDHHHHDHQHDHGHVHDEHCGHSHGPTPDQLAGPGGWWRGITAVVAVGARPCSGAILVLVFALAQGLFWAGVAATFVMGLGTAITVAAIASFAVGARDLAKKFAASRPGGGILLLRGLEVAAAVAVLVFGLGLLAGYLVSERMAFA
jgi:ABC-type nickel/cobalt efflux system permease component RcnA